MVLRYLSNLPYLAFLVAWLGTFTLASVLHSLSVLYGLHTVGTELTIAVSISFIAKDWLGLLPSYGVILLIGLCLALGLTNPIFRLVSRFRDTSSSHPSLLWYAMAGAVMMLTIIAAMYPILGVHIIAGTRGFYGVTWQSIAGVCGGILFYWVKSKQTT